MSLKVIHHRQNPIVTTYTFRCFTSLDFARVILLQIKVVSLAFNPQPGGPTPNYSAEQVGNRTPFESFPNRILGQCTLKNFLRFPLKYILVLFSV
jgi:hypothetical protein